MEHSVGWGKTRLIAILRTLDLSYYDVENILNLSGNTISAAEKWLKGAPFDEVASVFTIDNLQKVVNEVLTDKNINPIELVKAARLTPNDILEHYRKDFPEHKIKTPKPFGASESAFHQKHHQNMLKQIERLKTDLNPDLSAPNVRKLIGPTKTKRDIKISNMLNLDENPETKIVGEYLTQHFYSSDYNWVMNDEERGKLKWTRTANEELNKRIKLLSSIDRKAYKTTGFAVGNPNSIDYIGPSYWFSDSIFDAVLEDLYRNLEYKIEQINNNFLFVKYGASSIGRSETKEEADSLHEFHRQLMTKYEKSKRVKAIKKIKRERNTIAEEITNVLSKFIVDKHIPGTCDYEFCI